MKDSRKDKERLKEILEVIIEPFRYIGEDAIVYLGGVMDSSFRPQQFPIYKRTACENVYIYGWWWSNNENIPTKIYGKKTLKKDYVCFVREHKHQVDVEIPVQVRQGDKRIMDWFTCTMDQRDFMKLVVDGKFGPMQDICSTNSHQGQYY